MEPGQCRGQGPIHGGPGFRRLVRQAAIGERAPVNQLHDVEHGAYDAIIGAQGVGPGDRKSGRMKRRDQTVLAIHGMRRRQ